MPISSGPSAQGPSTIDTSETGESELRTTAQQALPRLEGHHDPFKVLLLCDGLHPGGKERRLAEVLKRLAGDPMVQPVLGLMSHEVHYPEALDLGIPVYYFIRKMRFDPTIAMQIAKTVKKERPALIHTWDPMTSVYAVPASVAHHVPLINGMITNAPPHRSWWSKRSLAGGLTFPFSRMVIANSMAGLRAYRVANGKGVCIHNGFDPARAVQTGSAYDMRQALGIATPFAVGMAGEFVTKKDYATYLAAAQRILEYRDDVTFLAIGDGKNREDMERGIAAEHARRIIFTGWRPDIEKIIAALDVGVLATNASVHGEGIPNVVMEYMAMGKPVVATDAGGTNELVVDGETGFLVSGGNVDALAHRIDRLLSDPDLMMEMGTMGRERITRDFSLDTMMRQLKEVYVTVLPHSSHSTNATKDHIP